ncbi:urease accessory protein UreF [Ensifer sp. ENS10]|uniref:urease accessory protein UreF n=1 Tax=unclassified Ensifer TaxID=2633371 RepID=UPI0007103BEB|nr:MULTISPECIES: urease accessory protein UreF [unclassified Ensifer]KRD69896.1 urease accessory protein UreF [Ensifer sp. Root278]MBD9507685.1 urease accessory protein UreF [Ensifer sp. ENS10]
MAERLDTQALLRLVTWMSPAFPVGAFSYSSGLEQAVHDRLITDAEELRSWLETVLCHGSGWNDALLFAESYRAVNDSVRLAAVADLAEALAGSRERHTETTLQGQAFLVAARSWPHPVLDALPETVYPVAVGAVAGAHETGLEPALAAFLNAAVSNAVSVVIRCGVIGQRDGVGVIAALEPIIAATAGKAANASLDDLGSATIMADISALKHETLHSRLFRS